MSDMRGKNDKTAQLDLVLKNLQNSWLHIDSDLTNKNSISNTNKVVSLVDAEVAELVIEGNQLFSIEDDGIEKSDVSTSSLNPSILEKSVNNDQLKSFSCSQNPKRRWWLTAKFNLPSASGNLRSLLSQAANNIISKEHDMLI